MTGLDLGLGFSRSRIFLRSRDQDLSYLVSRPRPEPSGLETKTLATRSRDRDQDLSFQVSSELEFETLGLEITSLLFSYYLIGILEVIKNDKWCFKEAHNDLCSAYLIYVHIFCLNTIKNRIEDIRKVQC